MSSRLVGRQRLIDSVNNLGKKAGLNVGQARRIVYNRNEWRGFVWENDWRIDRSMNP